MLQADEKRISSAFCKYSPNRRLFTQLHFHNSSCNTLQRRQEAAEIMQVDSARIV